jgi:hypothetical protein
VTDEQLPVLATEARPIEREDRSTELAQPIVITPAMQVAAATAASVVAGAAAVLAVKHHRTARLARRRRRARRHGAEYVKVLTTRSFLVDVSLVDKG